MLHLIAIRRRHIVKEFLYYCASGSSLYVLGGLGDEVLRLEVYCVVDERPERKGLVFLNKVKAFIIIGYGCPGVGLVESKLANQKGPV